MNKVKLLNNSRTFFIGINYHTKCHIMTCTYVQMFENHTRHKLRPLQQLKRLCFDQEHEATIYCQSTDLLIALVSKGVQTFRKGSLIIAICIPSSPCCKLKPWLSIIISDWLVNNGVCIDGSHIGLRWLCQSLLQYNWNTFAHDFFFVIVLTLDRFHHVL